MERIKAIRFEAEQELMNMFNCEVFLQLQVMHKTSMGRHKKPKYIDSLKGIYGDDWLYSISYK